MDIKIENGNKVKTLVNIEVKSLTNPYLNLTWPNLTYFPYFLSAKQFSALIFIIFIPEYFRPSVPAP